MKGPSEIAQLQADRRVCNRKRRFPNKTAARLFGKRWRQRAYECPACGGWHLSKSTSSAWRSAS